MRTTNFFSRGIKLQVTQYLFNWTWFCDVNSAMVYFLKVLAFGVRICLWVKVFCPTLFFLKTHTKLENSISIIHISTLLENSPSNKMHVYVYIYIYETDSLFCKLETNTVQGSADVLTSNNQMISKQYCWNLRKWMLTTFTYCQVVR